MRRGSLSFVSSLLIVMVSGLVGCAVDQPAHEDGAQRPPVVQPEVGPAQDPVKQDKVETRETRATKARQKAEACDEVKDVIARQREDIASLKREAEDLHTRAKALFDNVKSDERAAERRELARVRSGKPSQQSESFTAQYASVVREIDQGFAALETRRKELMQGYERTEGTTQHAVPESECGALPEWTSDEWKAVRKLKTIRTVAEHKSKAP